MTYVDSIGFSAVISLDPCIIKQIVIIELIFLFHSKKVFWKYGFFDKLDLDSLYPYGERHGRHNEHSLVS
jgi:hypothetical protein